MAGRVKGLLLLLGPLLATLLWRPRCLSGPDFRPLVWPARKPLAMKKLYRRLKLPMPDVRGAGSLLDVDDDIGQLDPDFFDDDYEDDDDDYYTDSDFSTAGKMDVYPMDEGRAQEAPRLLQARPQREREREPKMPGRFLGGESAEFVEEMKTPGRRTGVVTRWLNEKGIGWIELDDDLGNTVFAHYSKIAMDARNRPDQSSLRVGDHVEFDIGPDPKGPVALDITGIGRSKVQPGYAPYTKVDWRPDEPIRRVMVGNLTYHVGINALKRHFSQAGPVKFVDIKKEVLRTGEVVCNGCAMIRFENAKEARNAINMFHNKMFQGRMIMVKEHLEGEKQYDIRPDAERSGSLLPWT